MPFHLPFLPEWASFPAMTVADLNPDALAKLEAKLMADLEMVRKVRALLEEHQRGGAVVSPVPTAPPEVAPVPPLDFSPKPPARPREEVLQECLAATAGRPFAPQDFKDRVKALTQRIPEDKEVKAFLNRMIRLGSVVVHQERKGRPGHLYRSLLPATQAAPTAEVV